MYFCKAGLPHRADPVDTKSDAPRELPVFRLFDLLQLSLPILGRKAIPKSDKYTNIESYRTMASSVAQKRLFHEYKNLSTNPPEGITAGPVSEDDMFYWEALIEGPGGTPFEGGVFAAELKFPKDYPLSPPTMKFVGGGVWHPNGEFFPKSTICQPKQCHI